MPPWTGDPARGVYNLPAENAPLHSMLCRHYLHALLAHPEQLTNCPLPARSAHAPTAGAVLLVAFVYWEGGILLRQLRQRQQADRKQRELERRRQQGGSDDEELAAEGEQLRLEELEQEDDWRHHGQHPEWTQLDWARHERRRGLGWLALTTAGLIWLTGVVNGNPRPFQP